MSGTTGLLQARLFRGANEAAERLLAEHRPVPRRFGAGDEIFAPGEEAESAFLLLAPGGEASATDPLVQVELPAGSRPLRFDRVVEGDLFGELEFLSNGFNPNPTKRVTAARAITPATVLPVPFRLLAAAFKVQPVFLDRFVRLGVGRLLDALHAQHSQRREDPDLLLAEWLVELVSDLGSHEGNRVSFARKLSQTEIAADLGVSRETISRRLSEWERSGLIRTGAQSQKLEILDYQRVVRLAELRERRTRAILAGAVKDIDEAIETGELLRARNVALDMLRYYPSSPELHHRLALAAARSGNPGESLDIIAAAGLAAGGDMAALQERVDRSLRNPFVSMERLAGDAWLADEAEDEEDDGEGDRGRAAPSGRQLAKLTEDIAALEARALKELAFEAAEAGERQRLAEASFAAYKAAFDHTGGSYAGVNAATMALVAGRRAEAAAIGRDLVAEIGRGARDYWSLASLAEAHVVLGEAEEALKALARARSADGANDGAKASTALQFRRLAPLVGLDAEALIAELRLSTVVVTSGHMFRGTVMDAATQADAERAIRAEAETILRRLGAGYVYGSLACGADLVLAEAALDLGIEFHAILPFAIEQFIELSVKIGDPPGGEGSWETRFRAVLGRAAEVVVMDPADPFDRDLDGYFFHAFKFVAGFALQKAATLETGCALLAVSDGTAPENIAGTARAVAEWRQLGRPLELIAFPFPRKAPAGRPREASAFRPSVFVWSAAAPGADEEPDLSRLIARLPQRFAEVDRRARDGRAGACLIVDSVLAALDMAERLAETAAKTGAPVRVICDFGAVLGGDMTPDRKLLARLRGSSDMPGAPLRRPVATVAFGMQALFDCGDRIRLVAVGRTEAGDRDDGAPAKRRPSEPVFAIGPRSG